MSHCLDDLSRLSMPPVDPTCLPSAISQITNDELTLEQTYSNTAPPKTLALKPIVDELPHKRSSTSSLMQRLRRPLNDMKRVWQSATVLFKRHAQSHPSSRGMFCLLLRLACISRVLPPLLTYLLYQVQWRQHAMEPSQRLRG